MPTACATRWPTGSRSPGCTCHWVDAGVDTGPIIDQRAVRVEDDDTARDPPRADQGRRAADARRRRAAPRRRPLLARRLTGSVVGHPARRRVRPDGPRHDTLGAVATDPADLSPAALAFMSERHLATFTTLRRDGSPHVVPVGFTWDDEALVARVIAGRGSAKVAQARAGRRASLSQVDGRRWITLEGTHPGARGRRSRARRRAAVCRALPPSPGPTPSAWSWCSTSTASSAAPGPTRCRRRPTPPDRAPTFPPDPGTFTFAPEPLSREGEGSGAKRPAPAGCRWLRPGSGRPARH